MGCPGGQEIKASKQPFASFPLQELGAFYNLNLLSKGGWFCFSTVFYKMVTCFRCTLLKMLSFVV